MRKFMTVTVLLMAAMMILSCSDGSGSSQATGPVEVRFSVQTPSDSSRIVTVDDPVSPAEFTYEYAAVPQWEGVDFENIYGATGVDDNDNPIYADLGAATGSKLFAQGSWKFYAQVKVGDAIIYQSDADPDPIYINASSNTVNINVDRVGGNGKATISVAIEIPTNYEDMTGKLTCTDFPDLAPATSGASDGYTLFTGSAEIASGPHTFTFVSADRGGAIVSFDVLPGEARTITGTIESSIFQSTTITIILPGAFTVTVAGPTSVVPSSSGNTYTCTCTPSSTDATYQWYVGSEKKTGETSNTYSYNAPSAEQDVNIYCEVTLNGVVVSNGFPVTVKNQ